MLPYRPTGLQRRRYSYPLQLLVLACLSAALVVSVAALRAQSVPPAPAVLDANANPATARDYGDFSRWHR
jgi:hypothetical protein